MYLSLKINQWFKNIFKFKQNETTYKKEIIGGLTTFLTMAYIFAANPATVSTTGMNIDALFLITVLSSIIGTIVLISFTNLPLVSAPGMGINAFFTFSAAGTMGLGYQGALVAVLFEGILYTIIAITKIRNQILAALPNSIKLIIGACIGLFIAFVGLKQIGLITFDSENFLKLANLNKNYLLLGLAVLFLIIILYFSKIPGGMMIAMTIGMLVGLGMSFSNNPNISQGMPHWTGWNYGNIGSIKNYIGLAFTQIANTKITFTNPNFYIAIFMFLIIDFFDTAGMAALTNDELNIKNKKQFNENMKNILIGDGSSKIFTVWLGSSPNKAFAESMSGIGVGARTGLASLVSVICFILVLPLFPIFRLYMTNTLSDGTVVSPISAPATILVGILMFGTLKDIEWKKFEISLGSFFMILFTLLTFSLTNGLAFGFIFYMLGAIICKKWKELHWMAYILSGLFIAIIILGNIFGTA